LLCRVDCGQGRHVHNAADRACPRKNVNWLGGAQKDWADSYPLPRDDLQNVEGDIRRVEIWHDQEIGLRRLRAFPARVRSALRCGEIAPSCISADGALRLLKSDEALESSLARMLGADFIGEMA
jgi:hypothetical protein